MIQYLPPAIMFLVTVAVCALFVLPMRKVQPRSRVLRFYWRGVWVFLIAIASVAGAMNTLTLLRVDVVEEVQLALNLLIPAMSAFVVIGWFHVVGAGLFGMGRRIARS